MAEWGGGLFEVVRKGERVRNPESQTKISAKSVTSQRCWIGGCSENGCSLLFARSTALDLTKFLPDPTI